MTKHIALVAAALSFTVLQACSAEIDSDDDGTSSQGLLTKGADGKPTDGKPAADKPTDGKPAADKPTDGKPAADKPEPADSDASAGSKKPGDGQGGSCPSMRLGDGKACKSNASWKQLAEASCAAPSSLSYADDCAGGSTLVKFVCCK